MIFTVYSQNPLPAALLCHLADIPLRLAHCRENPYQLLTDWVPEPEPENGMRHEVRRQLDLVAESAAATGDDTLSLQVPRLRRRRAHAGARRARASTPARPWLVVHPGATAPSRRYPPERFAASAGASSRSDGLQVVFTGSDDGTRAGRGDPGGDGRAVASRWPGELDLAELAALIAAGAAAHLQQHRPGAHRRRASARRWSTSTR